MPGALATSRSLDCRGRPLSFGPVAAIMGILNVTPDSFSDGGEHADLESAVAQGERLVAEGAAILDIGGQSTRPGYVEISDEEEMTRVVPVIEALVRRVSVPLSIDTYKPAVARAALAAGAHVVNDVFGLLRDPEMAAVAAHFDAPVIAMHQEAGFKEAPGDVVAKLRRYFDRTRAVAEKAGVPADRIVIDPGIGFLKTQSQNLELIGRLDELRAWGWPVLLGASRKSVIGNVLELPANQRLEGTLATTALAAWHGVEIIRVHEVAPNLRAARMIAAIRQTSLS